MAACFQEAKESKKGKKGGKEDKEVKQEGGGGQGEGGAQEVDAEQSGEAAAVEGAEATVKMEDGDVSGIAKEKCAGVGEGESDEWREETRLEDWLSVGVKVSPPSRRRPCPFAVSNGANMTTPSPCSVKVPSCSRVHHTC